MYQINIQTIAYDRNACQNLIILIFEKIEIFLNHISEICGKICFLSLLIISFCNCDSDEIQAISRKKSLEVIQQIKTIFDEVKKIFINCHTKKQHTDPVIPFFILYYRLEFFIFFNIFLFLNESQIYIYILKTYQQ